MPCVFGTSPSSSSLLETSRVISIGPKNIEIIKIQRPTLKRKIVTYKLRKSPRKRPKNMPEPVIEYQQFEIIKDELEFRITQDGAPRAPINDKRYKFISTDTWFSYPDLTLYYGPSNITHIIRFIMTVQTCRTQRPEKTVCMVSNASSDQFLNAVLLAAFYLLLVEDQTPEQAVQHVEPLLKLAPKKYYKTEGSYMDEDPKLELLHCLQGLVTFIKLGLTDLEEIDIDEVAMKEHPLNGDMNWIIPGKILALAGPNPDVFSIEQFADATKDANIIAMVRLNRIHYDSSSLKDHKIEHHEMFISDGNIPTLANILEFCRIAEDAWQRGGALAVHCRAGLGRTGTMIAIYLIRKYKISAMETIAFLRMMRPGSVLGIQARYLETVQYLLRDEPIPLEAKKQLEIYYGKEAMVIEKLIRQLDSIVKSEINNNNSGNSLNKSSPLSSLAKV